MFDSDPSDRAPAGELVSVIIPVYNEARSIATVIERVLRAPLHKEICIIDDGSTDGTAHELGPYAALPEVKLIRHIGNRGKGAAIRTGLEHAGGTYVIIQDADLEYDPVDFPALLEPLQTGLANVVYGRRHDSPQRGALLYFGVRMLTLAANVLYGTHIHDEATGYKAFRKSLLDRIELKCERFEFCPEITAKASRLGEPIYEVPISYTPRSVAAGKKLHWTDGLAALWTLIRYRFEPRRNFDRAWRPQTAVVRAS